MLALLYAVLGVVVLAAAWYPCAAWKAPSVVVGPFTVGTPTFKVVLPVLGLAMVAVAIGLFQGRRMAFLAALAGLTLAVVLDVLSRRPVLAFIDLAQWGYWFTQRDQFEE